MKRSESNEHDLRIEAWLDGELPPEEAARFQAEMAADPDLLDELAMARAVQETLRGLPAEPCPPDLVPGVVATARREARKDALQRIRTWFRSGMGADWRPAFAMAMLLMVVFGSVLVDRSGRTAGEMDPAVAEALEQAKWTLALVADVGRRTGRTVREDVLEPHVVDPVQDAVAYVFEPSDQTNRTE